MYVPAAGGDNQLLLGGRETSFFSQVLLSAPCHIFLFTWHLGPLVEGKIDIAASDIPLR